MSILFANDHGWLLDSCSFINAGFRRCYSVNEEEFICRFNKNFFNIVKPHILNHSSNHDLTNNILPNAESRLDTDTTTEPKTRKKRKRKQCDLNQGEVKAALYHEKVRQLVLEGCETLLKAGHHCGYFSEVLHEVQIKYAPTHECQLAALCDMAKQLLTVGNAGVAPVQAVDGHADLDARLDLFSFLTENPQDYACEVTLMGERYFLPPRSRFLLSDITRIQPLVLGGEKYDLIVIDPPWENKSVKRSSRYCFLPSSQLRQLPVSALSTAGCVVITWVTNRPRHLQFVREELYPHWGVKVVGEWLWVKVTRKGEFVFPLDSPHKKPYEVLVIGRFCKNGDGTTRSVECEIPEQRLIVSIPSALHSHKPSLSAVMQPYIKPNAKCLEMFARSLQPDWTSWGNEVIKFQHHSYFITESLKCTEDTNVHQQECLLEQKLT